MKKSWIVGCALVATTLLGCNTTKETGSNTSKKKPTKVILLIGDGMGLSQLSSAYFYGEGEPNFSRFKTIGLSKTSSSSHKITDSAAGATAFSIGKKTYNGAIGVNSDTLPESTILEDLSAKGWNSGLVSTSSITHATPASFYAHVKSRAMQEEIALELMKSEVDFFAGGGYQFFSDRTDSINYLDSLSAYGFRVDTLDRGLGIVGPQKPAFLMAPTGLLGKHEGRDDFLITATERAIEHLESKKEPYFLMIEGSQIDWGGHANIAEYVIQEVVEFDKVIGKVLDFAEKDGNTLVIVTADHETGGFTLASETKEMPFKQVKSDYDVIAPSFSTGGHSATLIPVFAYGPGSEKFSGVYENTHIYDLMKTLSGL